MRELSLREVQLMQLDVIKKVDEFCKKNNILYYLIAGSCLGAVRHGGFIPWDDDIDIAMMRQDYDRFVQIFCADFSSSNYFLQNTKTDKYFTLSLSRICIKDTYMPVKSEIHHKSLKNTYIDVFPLDNVPDDEFLRTKQMRSLKIIDRIIALKAYHLYRDSFFEKLVKKTVSICLMVIPMSMLKKQREAVMTAYDQKSTQCVCSTTSKYGYNKQIIDRSVYGSPVKLLFEGVELNVPAKTKEYLMHLYGNDYMQLPPEEKRVKPHKVFAL